MTYEELKKIAQPHIRENDNLPSNSFWLLNQLHIPFKNEKQCEEDYEGVMNPLYNHPAFLSICNSEKTVYFNSKTRYWNFYIFHEIAHYLLNHEDDSPQNEQDANMLACILAAPVENLPTTFKTANDLSINANIPIDKAEEYWDIIKDKINHTSIPIKQKITIVSVVGLIVLLIIISILYTTYNTSNLSDNQTTSTVPPTTVQTTISSPSAQPPNSIVIVTSFGEKYHLKDCSHIKYKTNLTEYNVNDAINYGFEPCDDCIH